MKRLKKNWPKWDRFVNQKRLEGGIGRQDTYLRKYHTTVEPYFRLLSKLWLNG